MSKAFVDDLIHNMKLAGIVTKVTPWSIEGFATHQIGQNEIEKALNVRYLGIKLPEDWREIFSDKNNLLLKFIVDRSTAKVEFYLANTPPFIKIITREFTNDDKWETVLGEVKNRLKRDKSDVINHNEQINNIYARIQKNLK